MKTKQPRKRRLLALLLSLCLLCSMLPLGARVIAAGTGTDVWDGTVAAEFAGGDGSAEAPYQIATGAQLAYLRMRVNSYTDYEGKYFVLARDLNMNNVPWIPIGEWKKPFKGSIDGQGYSISNLTVSDASTYPARELGLGLFGVYEGEYIQNLNLHAVTILSEQDKIYNGKTVSKYCGALVGDIGAMTRIENCHVQDVTIRSSGIKGGLVGRQARGYDSYPRTEGRYISCSAQNVIITQLKNDDIARSGGLVGCVAASITGDSYLFESCRAEGSITVEKSDDDTYACVGGLFGSIDNGWYISEEDYRERADFLLRECHAAVSIQADGLANTGGLIADGSMLSLENCHAAGDVAGGRAAGGLVGNGSRLLLTGCSASGNVNGSSSTGGLIGMGSFSKLSDCSATGAVTASGSFAGGLIGYGQKAELENCFASGNVTSSANMAGGLLGGGYDSIVTDCYAAGDVTAEQGNAGGLVGWTSGDGNTAGSYQNCFAFGRVQESKSNDLTFARPLVNGSSDEGVQVENCYYNSETSGRTDPHGTDKTKAQFADGTVAELLGDAFVGRTDFPHPVLATLYQSNLATLKSLSYYVNGGDPISVPNFAADGDFYTVSLPRSTPRDTVITLAGICADKNAVITENTGVTLIQGAAMEPAAITVKAQDGTTKDYTLYFETEQAAADLKDAAIGGIEGKTFAQSETPAFTAIGAGMDDSSPVMGDQRYRPVSWKIDDGTVLSGNFTVAPFTGSLDLSRLTVGTHTLTVEHTWEQFEKLYEDDKPTDEYGWIPVPLDEPEAFAKTVAFTVAPALYTLTFDADGGAPIPPAQTLKAGDKPAAIDNPKKEGYTFLGWYDGETKMELDSFKMPANDITLIAKWEKQQNIPSEGPDTGSGFPAWALCLLAMGMGGILFPWKSLRRKWER